MKTKSKITVGIALALFVVGLLLAGLAWSQRNKALSQASAVATAKSVAEISQATVTAKINKQATAQTQVEIAQATIEAKVQAQATAQADAEMLAEIERQRADELSQLALAQKLAAQAVLNKDNIVVSTLLAVESLKQFPTLEGDQALRPGLDRLPRPVSQMGHNQKVWRVVFSPDGQWLATESGSFDVRTIHIWEASTGRKVVDIPYEYKVPSMRFSPDSKWLAIRDQGTVWLWNTTTGEEVTQIAASVASFAFSADAQWLVTAGGSQVQIWEIPAGEAVMEIPHQDTVRDLVFSPDGQWLATGADDGTVQIWQFEASDEPPSVQEVIQFEHEGSVKTLIFDPNGERLAVSLEIPPDDASGERIREVVIWNIATEQEMVRMSEESPVYDMAFSADGHWLLTKEWLSISVWDASTGEQVKHTGGEWHPVWDAAFSPDGQWLAIVQGATSGGSVWVENLITGEVVTQIVNEYGKDRKWSVAFSPDGRWLATGSGDAVEEVGEASVWDLISGQEVARIKHGSNDIALSPDGQRLVTVGGDGKDRVWDMATAQEVTQFQHDPHTIWTVTFSPDGQRIATGSSEAQVWDANTGQEIFHLEHEDRVQGIAFSPDGRWLATASGAENDLPGMVQVWDMTTGQEVARKEYKNWAWSVAFSPDSQWLAAGSQDEVLRVWEAATGREVFRFEHEEMVQVVSFSPDGQWMVTGSENIVRVWDLATWQEVIQIKHDQRVHVITFSPDNRWLATGSGNWNYHLQGEIHLWDTTTQQEVAHMFQKDTVWDMAFSFDGQWLATASYGPGVHIWEIPTGQEVARMQHSINEGITFTRDDRWLVTGGRATTRVWRWQTEDLIAEACARLPRNFTPREWREFFGNESYRRTCPNLPLVEE